MNDTLKLYMQILQMTKTDVQSGLREAAGRGILNLDEDELNRVCSLVDTLIETSSMKSYDTLQKTLVAEITKKQEEALAAAKATRKRSR